MNKLNKILLMLILSLSFSYAKADCSEEELTKLKEEADKIEITYRHLENEKFNVDIKNIDEKFYVVINGLNESKLEPKNGEISTTLITKKWEVEIYYKECNSYISSIEFRLPQYNIYYEDELCKDIDPTKFALCGKYYEYNISREEFEKRVKSYRNEHKISNNTVVETKEEKQKFSKVLNIIFNNIRRQKKYLLITILLLILLLGTVILINKRKNRGVLK